ncbi:MAG: Ig-like domain-containing protein [Acidimicrobiales bacterium]
MSESAPGSTGWTQRPLVAAVLRLVIFLLPLITAIAFISVADRVIERPGGLFPTIAWFALLTAAVMAIVYIGDRILRHLLPIVALFRLSLVFPDHAPSRFKLAIRHNTVRQLQRSVAEGTLDEQTPQEAAEHLLMLAAELNRHDRLTRGHTERVRAYSLMIGEEMGLPEHELAKLHWAGLIHDVGKLSVPPEILCKNGRPDDEEWAILRSHPAMGAHLVEPLRGWLGSWADAASQHHERWDGGGYPNGLAAEEISLSGRIVAVADAYDVITSARSYKPPHSAEFGRKELAANAGTQFDPQVVRAFLSIGLGRLRLVMGPMSWLTQLPVIGQTPVAPVATTAITSAMAVVGAALSGLMPTVVDEQPEPAAIGVEFIADDDIAYVAPDLALATSEDAEMTADLGDLLGSPDSIRLLSTPNEGTLHLGADQILRYTPGPDATGTVVATVESCKNDRCTTSTVTIAVTSVNDDPVATPDTATTNEDSPVVIDVLANDTDADGDTLALLSVARVGGYIGDSAAIVSNGVRYTPPPDANGRTVLEYQIGDGNGGSATGRVTVDIVPVNDAPKASADGVSTPYRTEVLVPVLANDTDVDGDPLTIVAMSDIVGGTATHDGANVTFKPAVGFQGTGSLRYTVQDPAGARASATATIIVGAAPVRMAAFADTAAVLEDGSALIHVLANDLAGSGGADLSTLAITSDPTSGSAVVESGKIRFTPAADRNGVSTFEYEICDLVGSCSRAWVSVSVTAVNDAPSFTAGSPVTVSEDAGLVSRSGWARTISPGPADETGQSVVFSVKTTNPSLFVTAPAVSPSGTLTFRPRADAHGTATITVTAADNGGTSNGGIDRSDPVTALISVTSANDAPIANDDSTTIAEDAPFGLLNVLANDTDSDLDFLSVSGYDASGIEYGTLTLQSGGVFRFVPGADWNGVITFSYTVTDGAGGSDSAVGRFTVTPGPDAPIAADDGYAGAEDTDLVVVAPGLLTNDGDPDREPLTVETTPVVVPSDGSVVLAADGSFTYTPDPGFVGTDTFVYRVRDPGGSTDVATVRVLIDDGISTVSWYLDDRGGSADDYDLVVAPPASSDPVFDADGDDDPGLTIEKSGSLLGRLFSPPGDEYQTWTLPASAGTVSLDGPVTLQLWSSTAGFHGDHDTHPYIWLYDCLGSSCTSIASTDFFVEEWGDEDDEWSYREIDLGTVTHDVLPGHELVLWVQFTKHDMWIAMTADYPSALVLTTANVAPVAVDDAEAAILEDAATVNIDVLANDVDPNIDPTSVTITSPASRGTAVPRPDGTIDYTPTADANGAESFDYQVCDSVGLCATATVSFTITAVNDAPSFTGGPDRTVFPGSATFAGWASAISAGAANESSQVLSFVVTGNTNPGIFSVPPAVDSSGALTFTGSSFGTSTITIELRDDGGGTDTSTPFVFTVTVDDPDD